MFHAADGVFFERTKSGGVQIVVTKKEDKADIDRIVLLSDSAWASVVSSVSNQGESYETHQEALHFHNLKKGEM